MIVWLKISLPFFSSEVADGAEENEYGKEGESHERGGHDAESLAFRELLFRFEIAVVVPSAGSIVHVAVEVRAAAIGSIIQRALIGGVVEVG